MYRTCLATILFCSSFAIADELADKIRAIADAPEYKQARWGVLVVDAKTGETVYDVNPDKLIVPASVTKLFTCATAINELGPDFKFTTPVYRRGEVTDRVLDGDLVLVASGDLTFGSRRGKSASIEFTNSDHTYANGGSFDAKLTDTNPLYALDELARQVARNISEVKGEIIVDDRLFARSRATGSGPEVIAPILVNDNVLDLTITAASKEGEPASVKMSPPNAYYQMDADVRTGPEKSGTTITLEAIGPNQFMVRGRVPLNSLPAVRIVPVDDPTSFARALFIEALRRNGVKVGASSHRLRRFEMPPRDGSGMSRIAEYQSEPLADALKVTLKVSHNLYASTLPILVGLKSREGTIESGLRRQGKVLKSFGIDPTTISFAGGAGGAQADSTTPRATVKLLQAMAKHAAAKEYFDALPILGVDGTLAESVPSDSPAKGKARGKTGTLAWQDVQNDRLLLRSKALAGEIETAKGTKLYFAMFLNDMPMPRGMSAGSQGKVLGRICEAIYTHGP